MTEIELIYSKHCQRISSGGRTVQLEIYGTGKKDWLLEVVDEHGNSTCWVEPFDTDEAAFEEFQRTLAEEGIDVLIGAPPAGKRGEDGTGT